MAKTIVGLFDQFDQAQRVVQELIDNGFSRENIGIAAREQSGTEARSIGGTDSQSTDAAGVGALSGGVLGGALGLLVGLGVLAIPGVGPVLAAGPLAAALSTALGAGVGAAAGGLLGGLVGAGVPEDDARYYAEGVRRGGTLVTVHTEDNQAEMAYDIMRRYNAVDMKERGADWESGGWDSTGQNAGDEWRDSSKAGTTGGALSGAATGAAIGAAGGPVGAAIGGIAGAAVGGGAGAAGDIAGEKAEHGVAKGTDKVKGDRGTTGRSDLTGSSMSGSTTTGERSIHGATDTEMSVPVVEEEIDIGKRRVETGGVRVSTHIEERPVEENVTLREERVHVERRPVNRDVSTDDMAAFKEGTIEVRETHEEPVVRKRARVVEEVVIDRDVAERTETIRDTVRRTDVDVEQLGGTGSMSGTGGSSTFNAFSSYENDFRSHYQTTYGSASEYTYDDYAPLYRYGYDLASNKSYSGREWNEIEPDARRRWEEHNPNTWEQYKDTIRYTWDRIRGKR